MASGQSMTQRVMLAAVEASKVENDGSQREMEIPGNTTRPLIAMPMLCNINILGKRNGRTI